MKVFEENGNTYLAMIIGGTPVISPESPVAELIGADATVRCLVANFGQERLKFFCDGYTTYVGLRMTNVYDAAQVSGKRVTQSQKGGRRK
jgi:hypothetical protein